jgi:hypothetical protein
VKKFYSSASSVTENGILSRHEKLLLISKLAEDRRCNRYKYYNDVSDFHGGVYDQHQYVSPITQSACNVDSPLMLIAQDWLSVESIIAQPPGIERDFIATHGYSPKLRTNTFLHLLLREYFFMRFEDVYATNAFVYIKPGRISSSIPTEDLLYSIKRYTLEEIRIVRPVMIICIGLITYRAVRAAIGNPCKYKNFQDFLPINYCGALVYASYHTGSWGTKAAGGEGKMRNIWKDLSEVFYGN